MTNSVKYHYDNFKVKKLIGFIAGSLSTLVFTVPAFAIDLCPQQSPGTPSQFGGLCNLNAGNFGQIIGTVVTLVFIIAIVIALFWLLYGGIKWILSEGDKNNVEAARNHIIAAIIGLIVIFLAYFILNLLVGFFAPGSDLRNLTIPDLTGITAKPTCAPGVTPTVNGPCR